MKSEELFLKDGRSSGAWYCGECRIIHREKSMADKCCAPVICDCGATVQEKYWLKCATCRDEDRRRKERDRFEAAEKVTEWGGYVYCDGTGSDGFSPSVAELIDSCEMDGVDVPEYVWACTTNDFAVITVEDVKDLLDGRESYEDFSPSDMEGWDELGVALKAFNAKNAGVLSYSPDYRKAVIIKKPTQ